MSSCNIGYKESWDPGNTLNLFEAFDIAPKYIKIPFYVPSLYQMSTYNNWWDLINRGLNRAEKIVGLQTTSKRHS